MGGLHDAERCRSGRTGRSRKPLCILCTVGSNPTLSAIFFRLQFWNMIMPGPTSNVLIPFQIERQPDPVTCGATCLHGLYRFFQREIPLERLVREVPQLKTGGTHGVLLGQHALRAGFSVELVTYNLYMFDPTWFAEGVDLAEKLRLQMAAKPRKGFQRAAGHYLRFLEMGGQIRMADLTSALIRGYLRQGLPILTGLNSTYLYREARVVSETNEQDDVRGTPEGHFVVLCGCDQRSVRVADPYHPNAWAKNPIYEVPMDRMLNAILLGIVTYDANLVVLRPQESL